MGLLYLLHTEKGNYHFVPEHTIRFTYILSTDKIDIFLMLNQEADAGY
jgi:hypothetical protein